MDVAFIAKERLIRSRPNGYCPGAPDVANEIFPSGDTVREVQEQLETWLASGSQSAWLGDLDRRGGMV